MRSFEEIFDIAASRHGGVEAFDVGFGHATGGVDGEGDVHTALGFGVHLQHTGVALLDAV